MARRRIAVVCGKTMTLGAAAVMVLAGPAAERASAQSFWTEASTLGYGGLAGATSMAFMCWHDCDSYRVVVVFLASTVSGLVAGNRIGASAESAARRNEWPSGRSLLGVRVGTVAGFATVGAGLAAGLTEGDESTTLVFALVGVTVGAILEVRAERALAAAVGRAAPSLTVDAAPFGGMSIGVRRTF